MERFWKHRLDHVIFWMATILFHMYTRIDLLETVGVKQFLLEILIRNGLLAIVIYTNIKVLIPAFIKRERVFVYIFWLSLSLLGYALLKNVHDVFLFRYTGGDGSRSVFFHNTFYNVSIALFYVAFSIGLELSRQWYLQREVIRQIEIEKLHTELEYLKAQINPHFLFNSINTIYFQIDKQNKVARETLSAFSEMLRYQLYECGSEEIPVEKEVSYLKHYVDLQRQRKDENYAIELVTSSDLHGFTLAPLLLIPFVENAFKHVSHFPLDNRIVINISREDSLFSFFVFNTREPMSGIGGNSGIGLKNVKRRLELIYNGRHQLTITEKPNSFEVKLAIKIIA
jgi:two-component system LytT family sensor kinase